MKNTIFYTLIKDFYLMYVSRILTPNYNQKLNLQLISNVKTKYKISYCTTCMGRLPHLKKTYRKNIEDNLDYADIEFVLVNYNSKDGLDEWVKKNLVNYVDKGILNYYHTTDPSHFHMSKAKNLAHRLGTGDILVNLDADNYLGKHNAIFTNYLFNQQTSIVAQFFRSDFRFFDTAGRIALKKDDFYEVLGYKEELLEYGYEDFDFLRRLQQTGLKMKKIEIINFLRTVKHSTLMRKENLPSYVSLNTIKEANLAKIKSSTKSREYNVNRKGFQKFSVVQNFQKPAFIV